MSRKKPSLFPWVCRETGLPSQKGTCPEHEREDCLISTHDLPDLLFRLEQAEKVIAAGKDVVFNDAITIGDAVKALRTSIQEYEEETGSET